MKPRKISSFVTIAALLVFLVLAGGVCHGWWPYNWTNGGYSGGFSQFPDLDKLPRFALFPPVYYSHPVPRTYGYTPFASLPELTTILETRPPQPLVVRNPYVPSLGLGDSSEIHSAEGPRIVQNPFVDRAEEPAKGTDRLAGR